jgi:excisionase family DNA binding protein
MTAQHSLTTEVDGLDTDGLVRMLGQTELTKVRILARLSPPVPGPAPQPQPTRGAPALTIKQAAERLRVSQAWVRRAIESGKLGAFRIGSRNWRIPDSAVARVEKGNG